MVKLIEGIHDSYTQYLKTAINWDIIKYMNINTLSLNKDSNAFAA